MIKELDFKYIKRNNDYPLVFHDTIIAQHSQYYLYNSQHDLDHSCAQDKQMYYPLNKANFLLGKFCKEIMTEITTIKAYQTKQELEELKNYIITWENLYNAGGVYDTFKYAKLIFEILTSLKYPVLERLQKEDELINAFIAIPYHAKSLFQIIVLIPEKSVLDFIDKFILNMSHNPSLKYYVSTLRINQLLTTYNEKNTVKNLRKLKVVFVPKLINSIKNPIINELIEVLIKITEPVDDVELNEKFSLRINNAVYLCQGNINYKNFLQLLNILDAVYDKKNDYIFIK